MEAKAQVIVANPRAGVVLSAVGDLYRILATGEQTRGAYSLMEAIVFPGGGPPLHWHTKEEEMFFVLEGEVTFQVAEEQVVAGAGSFLQVPRGVKHGFKNRSERKARMLIQTLPAGFDRFLVEIARPVDSIDATPVPVTPAEIARLMAVAPRYDIHICPVAR